MNRRHFTLALLAATAPMAVTRTAVAQPAPGAIPALDYLAAASRGGMLLEETSRDAFEKTANPQVKRFSRAEVNEQVNLTDKFAASGRMPSAAPGGVVGAVAAAPFAIVGGTASAVGTLFGAPMSSDAQKADTIARLRATAPGPAYDAAYVQTQIMGHQEALAIHGSYARSGDDPELRRIARGAVALVRLHLSQLSRMQAGMGGPQG